MAKIAVIGAGAVGCYYGALLARGGHDVRFLMRRDLAAVRAGGLHIESPGGNFHLPAVAAFDAPEAIGAVDWVICSLKTTSLGEAKSLVTPCLRANTRVVALMNGLGVEEEIAAWAEPSRVFGAMAFVCINRGEPGLVRHLEYGRVSIGHLGDDAGETEALRALLASAAIDVVTAPNLRFARWEKLAWNVPFNGLSVAGGGIGTEVITNDPLLRTTAETAMRELIATANADLAARASPARIDEEELVARMFALTATMGDYRTSMALDYAAGRPLEVETILGNPVRRARELGIATPVMETLYGLVSMADRRRRGLVASIPTDGG